MTTATPLTAREKAKLARHPARKRLPGEAMPYAISIFGKHNVYKPAVVPSARPGADDHLRHKSRGV